MRLVPNPSSTACHWKKQTNVGGKGTVALFRRPAACEDGGLMSWDHPSCRLWDKGFKGCVRKWAAGCVIRLCSVLRLVGLKVKFQPVWFYRLVVGSFPRAGGLLPVNSPASAPHPERDTLILAVLEVHSLQTPASEFGTQSQQLHFHDVECKLMLKPLLQISVKLLKYPSNINEHSLK